MEIDSSKWLEHLKDLPENINGYKTCTYLMALEGWRRGLKLKFRIRSGIAIPPSIQYSLDNGEKKHWFTVARGDKVTNEAIKICMEKPKTYEYLRKNNVPIPEGSDFTSKATDAEIIAYAQEIGFPLVLKPTNAGAGRGVMINIKNIEELNKALIHVRESLGFKEVIVERFIEGEDYRVYVLDNKVIGAYRRESANVRGDGVQNISQLIQKKNQIRGKNPFIKRRLIKIDDKMEEYLKEQNLNLETIPKKGEKIYLRRQGENLSERDPVDITDEMSTELKEIAVKAMHSIPGLTHCDVDMLVNEKTGEGYVNEINSRPQISNHLYPLEGIARDIPKKIIDFYFPETKNSYRNDLYYFDFEPIYQAHRHKNVREITIPNLPQNHEIVEFRLTGNLKNVNYENWVRRNSLRQNLHGYIKHLKNGETSVVVSGTTKRIKNFKNIIYNERPKRARVDTIKEYSRKSPIEIGFQIINTRLTRSKKEKRNMNELKKVQKEYDEIINSTSWKITKPLRKIKSLFKK